MFNLDSTIQKILIVIIIIALIYCCFKFKNGRIIIITGLIVLFVGFTAYAGIQVNYYYTAEGGIKGEITGIFETNKVEVVDNIVYSFNNVELTKKSDSRYSASITIDEILDKGLTNKTNYAVFVNDTPCTYSYNEDDYVIAKYTYQFLNSDIEELITDTLNLQFAFYTNSTYLNIYTDGGAEAVKYWNYYFNKNKFEVSLKVADYVNSDDINYSEGDISNYCIASYYDENNELIAKQVYTKGSKIKFLETEKYKYWTIDNVEVSDYIINSNVDIHLVSTIYNITFDANGGTLADDEKVLTLGGGESLLNYPIPTKENYVLVGWKNESGTLISTYRHDIGNCIGTYKPYKDETLTAEWINYTDLEDIDLEITSNINTEISIELNENTYQIQDFSNINVIPKSSDTLKLSLSDNTNFKISDITISTDGNYSITDENSIYTIKWANATYIHISLNIKDLSNVVCNISGVLSKLEVYTFTVEYNSETNVYSGERINSTSVAYPKAEFEISSSGEMSIYGDIRDLTVETNGNYDIEQISYNNYKITWTDCSYLEINLTFYKSTIVGV